MIRNDRYQSVSFSVIFIVGLVTLFGENGEGFQPRIYSMKMPERQTFHTTQIKRSSRGILLRSSRNPVLFSLPSENESDSVRNLIENNSNNFDNEINEGDLEDIEPGQQRPDWRTMQQVNNMHIPFSYMSPSGASYTIRLSKLIFLHPFFLHIFNSQRYSVSISLP